MNSDFETLYATARLAITHLRRQLAAQHRYIAELEKQLEPGVVDEIRDALEAQAKE